MSLRSRCPQDLNHNQHVSSPAPPLHPKYGHFEKKQDGSIRCLRLRAVAFLSWWFSLLLWIYGSRADNWIKLQEQFEKFLKVILRSCSWCYFGSPLEFHEASLNPNEQQSHLSNPPPKKDFQWIIPFNTLTQRHKHTSRWVASCSSCLFSGKRQALINVTLRTRTPWCRDWRHDSHKPPSQTATCHISNTPSSSPSPITPPLFFHPLHHSILHSSRCGMRVIPRSGKKKGRTLPRCLFSFPLAITQLRSFVFHRSNHS